MIRLHFSTGFTSILTVFATLAAGCAQSGDPTLGQRSSAVAEPVPETATPGQVSPIHYAQRIAHRIHNGTCIMVVPPPQPYALRPDGTHMLPHEIIRPKLGEAHILYLHFEGCTVTPGQDNPDTFSSFIPWNESVIPEFDHTAYTRGTIDTREKVIDAIRRWVQYFYAHNDLLVVTEQPPPGTQYGMMIVGGAPGDIGEPSGVLGISPWDCDKFDRNVSFTFSEDHDTMQMLVQTITHEAGHAFGLSHIANTSAVMNPQASMQEVYWGSGTVPDGQACDGGSTQDSFEVLKEHIGERDDNTPPWVEIYKPGQDAIVPNAFQALVHGTDNVVLYAVEFFVDGASVRRETLPEFAFQLSELTEGAHQLWVIGEDAHGNTFTSEPMEVLVEANCGALSECTTGLSGVGELCNTADDCMTGLCAEDSSGLSVCSRVCDVNDPCPWGTECTPTDSGDASATAVDYYCASGPAPVHLILPATSNYQLSGCAASGTGSAPAGTLLVLLAFGLLALRRRR